ncbi:MAG: PEP-CTERM sorting domain-containing protein [Rhodospirillales bacterium]|nr:PEP-CTERM sorting domain-containing protein [Rhodospirillales bacterium]
MAALAAIAACGGWLVSGAVSPAHATPNPLTFDFGTLGANGGSLCSSNCVLPGTAGQAVDFSQYGISLTATGYHYGSGSPLGVGEYVSQKPNPPNATNEAGLGESNTSPTPSDPQNEIGVGNAVVLDNAAAIALGWTPVSITIGSLQSGENADIFGGSTPLELKIGTVTGTPDVQTVNLATTDTYVTVTGGNYGNSVLLSETFSFTGSSFGGSSSVPEPTTLAIMASGLLGLTIMRRRRRG